MAGNALRPRVLVVDDDPAIRRLAIRELRVSYEVLLAADVEQGVRLLKETPDLAVAVVDLSLEGRDDGLVLLGAALRLHPRSARVLISGTTELEVAEHALLDGTAQQFVSKPWSLGTLCEVVDLALANSCWRHPHAPTRSVVA